MRKTRQRSPRFYSQLYLQIGIASVLRAGNGADGNIMDDVTLRHISASGADLDVQSLDQPRVFDMESAALYGRPAKLLCSKNVLIDTELHIYSGSEFMLFKVECLVTDQRVNKPLLGRLILDRLRLNTREILAAMADRFAETVEVVHLLVEVD